MRGEIGQRCEDFTRRFVFRRYVHSVSLGNCDRNLECIDRVQRQARVFEKNCIRVDLGGVHIGQIQSFNDERSEFCLFWSLSHRLRYTATRPGLSGKGSANSIRNAFDRRLYRQMTDVNADVVVVGGGPSGTTAAALLAERGYNVVLLEKDNHPRFHIGESLLPNNLPIFERLGVLDQVAAIGVFKPGADFTAAGSPPQPFPFARALGDSPDHAYQVKRAELDQLLFENCRRLGVDAREGHTVLSSAWDGQRHQLSVRDTDGNVLHMTARFLIDASGREGFLAARAGWRKKNPRHASAAIFGHFTDVVRREGDLAGNISVYWFDHGWIWMIPLRDDVMSIGAVCWPEYLRSRKVDLEQFLKDTLAAVPEASDRVRRATAVTPVNATGNYSYRSTRICGDGFLMVGDAYAFIDPVFSSGVYLAMNSGQACVPVVESWLRDDRRSFRRMCRAYHRDVDRKLLSFCWFIYRFTTPAMRDMFRHPRNDWQVEQAVIAMLVGDGDGSRLIRSRLRIFKVIYHVYRLGLIPASIAAWWKRRRNVAVDFADETILS